MATFHFFASCKTTIKVELGLKFNWLLTSLKLMKQKIRANITIPIKYALHIGNLNKNVNVTEEECIHFQWYLSTA